MWRQYSKTVVEARENKVEFYEQMLYEICGEAADGDTFRCIRMEKDLSPNEKGSATGQTGR